MPKLSLFKSGWFYLWIVLSIVVIWGNQAEVFQKIEAINLKLWGQTRIDQVVDSEIVRLVIPKQAKGDLSVFERLVADYPLATIAVVADLGQESISKLRYKDFLFAQNLILLNDTGSSLSAIKSTSEYPSFGIFQPSSINWQTSANLKIAVQKNHSVNAIQLIWANENNLYTSFVAESVANSLTKNSNDIIEFHQVISSVNHISVGKHQFDLGMHGEIYPLGGEVTAVDMVQLEQKLTEQFAGVIVVDDLSKPQARFTSIAINDLLQKNYLVSTFASKALELVLLISLVLLVIAIRSKTLPRQLIYLTCYLIMGVLTQVGLVSLNIWMPLHVLLLLGVISFIIQIGFYQENNHRLRLDELFNQLLIEATPYFYRNQKMESVLLYLKKSDPNAKLIESIKEIAIEAEAHKNLSLAKQLHQWTLESDPKNKFSRERLKELDPQDLTEELDQTIVIQANGETILTPTTGVLNIKNFGRYQVEGVLGKGAMGVVFQGVDPKINRHVAIKTLQLTDELDNESLVETKQRFFREAETAGNLSHANIVTIYDVGEQVQENSNQSLGYIAMDLLTGAPLSEFIKRGKLLPPSLVYQLMIQITDALDYAHRQKVIHRDIKPGNIIYDDDLQRGTVTDFGIAYMSDHSKTKTGTIMGSPYYMSPEQVMGITVDGRSDIFSLGVTFYQLLSGHLPFNGESIASVAFHITKTKHESVRNWNKKLPTSAARITNKAMQKDPAKRYQTMQEFKQALINALKRDYKKSPIL